MHTPTWNQPVIGQAQCPPFPVLPEHSREYVLGLLNSSLLDWVVKQTATQMRGGWFSFESRFIRDLPIKVCDPKDQPDKARHDKVVGLVETMLKLQKDLPKAKTPHEQESIQRQIAATDKQIDEHVYELYGLTEDEIRVGE